MGKVTAIDQRLGVVPPASVEVREQEELEELDKALDESWSVPPLSQSEREDRGKTAELVDNKVVALPDGTLAVKKEPEKAPTPVVPTPSRTTD